MAARQTTAPLRFWPLPLAAVVLIFLATTLPNYLSFDPAQARLPPVEDFPPHYPLLVAHILAATIAMVAGFCQVWPWLRARHPRLHRRAGRVYVFAGVLPAGISGLVIGAVSPFGPATATSNVILALLWLATTAAGFHAARQRRFAEHREWMLRSAVLTFSIIGNRVVGPVADTLLRPGLDTTFAGSKLALGQTTASLSAWLGWTIPLIALELYLINKRARLARSRIG
ncbi:DUF2306 domain-containing protein [Actinokineospora pegani]|uniref:DUF2306 domain-containing protein n=1 Tax=Actinokineospora pegani TaxID=2654637 RepID=UPI0012EA1E13|nr:DUF2306 domain-containing protein [Actinokineospora pegani]